MKFEQPAAKNPTDRQKGHRQAHRPLRRQTQDDWDRAKYAYEWHDIAPKPAYGYVLGAAIAKGRIASLDTGAAESSPGVFAVVTAQNAGALGQGQLQHRQTTRRPRSAALSPGGRPGRRANFRGGARGVREDQGALRRRAGRRMISSRRRTAHRSRERSSATSPIPRWAISAARSRRRP